MPAKKASKKKRRARKIREIHTHLALRLDGYEARAEAEINYHVHDPRSAWDDPQDEPLYRFLSHLELGATCVHPEDRAGDTYELTVYGEDAPQSRVYWKLRDVQAVDKHHSPQYREYRGKSVPVYVPPQGMGMLEKLRGEPRWHGAIWMQPRYVSDVLILLGHGRRLYLAIHEKKIERQRWIQGISVQTTDPAEE